MSDYDPAGRGLQLLPIAATHEVVHEIDLDLNRRDACERFGAAADMGDEAESKEATADAEPGRHVLLKQR